MEPVNPQTTLTQRSAEARDARKMLQGRWRILLVETAARTSTLPTTVTRMMELYTTAWASQGLSQRNVYDLPFMTRTAWL